MKTKEAAQQWIEDGGLCVYRYGWRYRGAVAKVITQQEALELLPKYSFGMGFYEISWSRHEGQNALEFNELSANDLC